VDVVGGGEGQLGLVVAHLLGGQDTQLIKGRPETITYASITANQRVLYLMEYSIEKPGFLAVVLFGSFPLPNYTMAEKYGTL
jgi:hypothetical protein